MWKIRSCARASVVIIGVWLAGCQNDPTADSHEQSSSARVSTLEAELVAAQGGLADAVDEAKACFADFRSCQEAAAAGSTDCANALKACLPGPVSIPVDCAPPPSGAPSAPGLPNLGSIGGKVAGGGLFGGLRKGADAGVQIPGQTGGYLATLGRQPGSVPDLASFCAALPPAAGSLVACKDSAGASASQQLDPAAIGAAFRACVGDAFKAVFDDICGRIATECEATALPAEACDRLAELCSDPALAP